MASRTSCSCPSIRSTGSARRARSEEIYDLQKNVVIVCGEGIVDEKGEELGAEYAITDPAGNMVLSGASEALRAVLIRRLGDDYFT